MQPEIHDPLLSVRDLSVTFDSSRGSVEAVGGVSFDVRPGRTLGIVGESGSGKTASVMALLGLSQGHVSGSARFEGRELVGAREADLRGLRGHRIGMVFQDSLASLDPSMRVGEQVAESLAVHRQLTCVQRRGLAVELLERVGVPDAAERLRAYPHELSGGLRQRVLIAAALACEPSLLIADEPTTALDVTVQAQVMALLRELQKSRSMALVLITHDLGLVAETCDHIVVMYAGRVVERGTAADVLSHPRHPYTAGLLASMPTRGASLVRLREIPGTVPEPDRLPPGCRFHDRCPVPEPRCRESEPAIVEVTTGHAVRCFAPLGGSP